MLVLDKVAVVVTNGTEDVEIHDGLIAYWFAIMFDVGGNPDHAAGSRFENFITDNE